MKLLSPPLALWNQGIAVNTNQLEHRHLLHTDPLTWKQPRLTQRSRKIRRLKAMVDGTITSLVSGRAATTLNILYISDHACYKAACLC